VLIGTVSIETVLTGTVLVETVLVATVLVPAVLVPAVLAPPAVLLGAVPAGTASSRERACSGTAGGAWTAGLSGVARCGRIAPSGGRPADDSRDLGQRPLARTASTSAQYTVTVACR